MWRQLASRNSLCATLNRRILWNGASVTYPLTLRHFASLSSADDAESSTITKSPLSSVWDQLTPANQRLALTFTREQAPNDPYGAKDYRRIALSKAITLCESKQVQQHDQAALLLTHLLEQEQCRYALSQSFRVGLAGAPGAGKSTMIEALGLYILEQSNLEKLNRHENDDEMDLATIATKPTADEKKKVKKKPPIWRPDSLAVVCIDPSSGTTGGSILGDKTRMTELSRNHDQVFVRPAPSGAGTLGGLATYTNDVVTLCQCAGKYPLVLVETVGVGQSEVEVQECVDYLIVLVPPAGGDDLQGVKKGIIEVADLVVVTKADGNLEKAATRTAADYKGAMQFLHTMIGEQRGGGDALRPQVLLASSVTKRGLDTIWQHVSQARSALMNTPPTPSSDDDDDDDAFWHASNLLQQKRQKQSKYWMWKNMQLLVQERAKHDPFVHQTAKTLEQQLEQGKMTPRVAAQKLLDSLYTSIN